MADNFLRYLELVGMTQFVWVVNTGSLNLTSPGTVPGVYYLAVNASDASGGALFESSHYINITAAATTTSSSASASSTAAPSGTPQSGTGTSGGGGNPTSSALSGTSTKKRGALSTGEVAGIAVACSLVGLGFLAGLVFLYRQNRKMRQQLAQVTAPDQHQGPVQVSEWKSELPAINERSGLGLEIQIAELGTGYGIGRELDGQHGTDGTS
jgi:hypothetical protein